jgi:hypothetical protein
VKALTVRPPWAQLIAAGIKDTENRTWRVEPGTRLWIHAGVNVDRNAWRMVPAFALGRIDTEKVTGAILARATVADVHTCAGSCSPWAIPGQVHWRLADVERLERPVPCRGMLGLWTPPAGLLEPIG